MLFHFFNCQCRFFAVNHCMAIRAHRPEVQNRIDRILGADQRKFNYMMYVNEFFTQSAICFLEVKTTNRADETIVLDALPSRYWISFIGINKDLSSFSLKETFIVCNFVRVDLFRFNFCDFGEVIVYGSSSRNGCLADCLIVIEMLTQC